MRWIDNHCHLDDTRLPAGGGTATVEAARAAGVERIVTVGVDEARSRACIALAQAHDGVFATVGLHPHDAVQGWEWIDALLSEPKVVAVGECGLDYYYDHSPREVQRDAFAAQVELAQRRDLTLVIHTRDAWHDTFAVLDEVGVPARTVFHCFTGGPDEARAALDRGAFISFSGIVSFPRSEDLREAARLCPLDRLLVETDAPYLTPVPHRGKPNTPAYVPLVGAAVADAKGVAVEEVAEATWDAAARAFRLPER